MGAVTIRKIDEVIKQALREEAAAKGHSVEAELRELLERTYGPHAKRPRGRKPGESAMDYLLRTSPDFEPFEIPLQQPIPEPRFP